METKLHGKLWYDIVKVIFGSALIAVSFRYLTFPNSIVSGGVMGIAQIVNLLTKLPVGAVTVAINAPLFVWAWKKLGKRFVALTLLCMMTSSVLIDLLAKFPFTVTEEPMLAAVYGGLLSGTGYGICYTTGATAGGTDIPSRMLRRKYPHINMTTFILSFNLVIIVTFALVFHRFDSCMYTLICMYITTKLESFLLYGPINSRLCYIISDKSSDLSHAITVRLHRGRRAALRRGADARCMVRQERVHHHVRRKARPARPAAPHGARNRPQIVSDRQRRPHDLRSRL